MSDRPDTAFFRYDRRAEMLRLTIKNQTNHELREMLIGVWSRLDDADRRDHIAELLHYVDALERPERHPHRFLSPVAQAIHDGEEGESAIDLRKLTR